MASMFHGLPGSKLTSTDSIGCFATSSPGTDAGGRPSPPSLRTGCAGSGSRAALQIRHRDHALTTPSTGATGPLANSDSALHTPVVPVLVPLPEPQHSLIVDGRPRSRRAARVGDVAAGPDADIRSSGRSNALLAPCPPRRSPMRPLSAPGSPGDCVGRSKRSSAGSVMLVGGSETRIPVAALRSAEEGVDFRRDTRKLLRG